MPPSIQWWYHTTLEMVLLHREVSRALHDNVLVLFDLGHEAMPAATIVNIMVSQRKQCTLGGAASHAGSAAKDDFFIFTDPSNFLAQQAKWNVDAVRNMTQSKFGGSTYINYAGPFINEPLIIGDLPYSQ